MPLPTGHLLFPALRWDPDTGFDHERDRIERAFELEVGGFIIFGGPAPMVGALTAELRAHTIRPLLIGSDLERGAGQQFAGATSLPPAAAIGELDDLDTTERAATITAREAAGIGINWVYAPVVDIDLEPRNPIVGTRAFGTTARQVERHVRAWIHGCQLAGAVACAKHFPGHGRTTEDSHAGLARVGARRATLEEDLAPFRAAIEAGVGTIMTAHVAYSSLDRSGVPATLSRAIVTDLLRGELGFEGVIATDALMMQGVLDAAGSEEEAAVRAIAAGCDALLYPEDMEGVAEAIAAAVGDTLDEARVKDALARVERLAQRAGPAGGVWGRNIDHAWASDLALRTLTMVRGVLRQEDAWDVITIDDDVGGPYPPPKRTALLDALREAGVDAEPAERPGERAALIAVYADIRAWKPQVGLSADARERLKAAIDAQPDALVVLFAHPRIAEGMPGRNVLGAWGGEPLMQRAAARRIAGG